MRNRQKARSLKVSVLTPKRLNNAPPSRTHHSTHRSSKQSAQSNEHHFTTLQNPERVHRTFQRKGTFTIETVQSETNKLRNSIQSQVITSPIYNLLKTPHLKRKNSGYQNTQQSARLDTNQNQPTINILPTIPSQQELPDSVRNGDIQFIGEISSNQPQQQSYLFITFKILNRQPFSQGIIGLLLFANLHFALAGLIDVAALQLIRFIQFDKILVSVTEMIIFIGFDVAIILIFTTDLIWTLVVVVVFVIDVLLEIIITKTLKEKSSE